MSSHHIVRENQEPALLIEDLFLVGEEDFGQLLEWSPTIVIEEKSIDILEARGYKFDIVFTQGPINQAQENLKVITYQTDFLRSAIEYLIDHQYKAINIVTDQIDIGFYIPYLDQMNIVLFSKGMRYFFVKTGFTKWKPKGEEIQVDGQGQAIAHSGLKRVTDKSYQTEKDGLFVLEFSHSKYILIGEKTS